MKEFDGKTAIITGGGAGIGKAICQELARKGAIVIVADISKESADQVAGAITQSGGKAQSARIDVTSEEEVKKLIEDTAARYGHLDYIFNNAGIAIGGDARDLTTEQWVKVFNVNYYGVLYGSIHAYHIMARQGFGHIINTSSGTGLMPQPGNTPYCASKHAVIGLSLSLRHEGEDLGVKVSTICPGHVRTDIYKNMEVAGISNEKMVASLPVKAMSVSEAADIILKGIIKNKAILIFPKNVKWAWRIYRFFPGLLDKAWVEKIRNIRRLRREA